MNKTPLFDMHKSLQARFINFAGWSMPFSYKNPKEEHLNTRKHGSLFDVSHMGQISIKGSGSKKFLQKILPTDISQLKQGRACYSVLCLDHGGMLDDIIVYALGEDDFLLCVNAGKKDEDKAWLDSVKIPNVMIEDISEELGLIAVQGPQAMRLCQKLFPQVPLDKMQAFACLKEKDLLLASTGYTGEKGLEIYAPMSQMQDLWENLLELAPSYHIEPAGLGARDTLRLEMAYLLSGQDFDESKTPIQAGLSWLVTNTEDYIGKSHHKPASLNICGFVLEEGAGVPRKGMSVLSEEGREIGFVTSGAKSPSLEKMIGLAYIENDKQPVVNIHNSLHSMVRVKGSFLKKKGEELDAR